MVWTPEPVIGPPLPVTPDGTSGNVIIMGKESPLIGLIDLGMVGRLSPELRDRTVDLMVAAVRKDSYAVADALYAIGRPTK